MRSRTSLSKLAALSVMKSVPPGGGARMVPKPSVAVNGTVPEVSRMRLMPSCPSGLMTGERSNIALAIAKVPGAPGAEAIGGFARPFMTSTSTSASGRSGCAPRAGRSMSTTPSPSAS